MKPIRVTLYWPVLALLLVVACSPAGAKQHSTKTEGSGQVEQQTDFSRAGWKTDFSKHSVPLSEITSGGPPRDGIPPIDHPRFVAPADAASWLKPQEPVIALSVGEDHRAYPLQILIWHEIVNDQVGDSPVTVTFCPLCNTAIAFDRRLDGRVLDFGTSGNLRRSDLVMWDRQTESWWQQATGTAIVGELTGRVLTLLPASIVSFASFRAAFPAGRVLSRDTGFSRQYGNNPYIGYDDVKSPPFLYKGPTIDGRLPPKERVVTVSIGDEDVAYRYSLLKQRGVVQDSVSGVELAVFYSPGTVSALGADSIPDSADVGSTGVFRSTLDGRRLTFGREGGGVVDQETHSRWDLLGRAASGPLAGRQLEPVTHADYFWFAWAAFRPSTRIYGK